METNFKMKVQGKVMESLFENNDTSANAWMVKYYSNLSSNAVYDPEKEYRYDIGIRHDENVNAKDAFKKAIKAYNDRILAAGIIVLAGVEYPTVDIENKHGYACKVSTDDLNSVILFSIGETGNYASPEYRYADEATAYYVPDDVITKSQEEIARYIQENIDSDFDDMEA